MNPAELRDLYERRRRVLARRPALGRAAESAEVRLAADGDCVVLRGARQVAAVDLPADDGGAGGAPHPGELMLASLGASLALGYRAWGARLGVAIERVELDVQCEQDARGPLGLDDGVAIGWQRLVVDARVVSDAPEPAVRDVVARAERLSPMLANLGPGIERVHRLTVLRAGAASPSVGAGTERPVPPDVTPLR